MSFVFTDPVAVLAVLCLNVFVTEWLVRHTLCRHLGTALLVIVVTAMVANLRLIPVGTGESPVYGGIFDYVAPMAIFFPLLQVNLRDVLKAGLPMILMFLLGAAGTVAGVLAGMWLIDGGQSLGEAYRPLGGMFVGTYVGGGVNFNALALHYGVAREGAIFAGSAAVDNIYTALWMIATIALPALLFRRFPRRQERDSLEGVGAEPHRQDEEAIRPADLGFLLALAGACVWISEALAARLASAGWNLPSVVILTTVALVLAQLPVFHRLKGARVLGMFCVYLFLAVIGASCHLGALGNIGSLGATLFFFVGTIILVHALVTFGLGALFRLDWDLVAVASQANIGGATSALALARGRGRPDLVLPGVLVGSLGYGLGTYLGFFVAEYLL